MIEFITPIAIHSLELMGIIIIIIGAIKAFYKFILNILTKNNYPIKV